MDPKCRYDSVSPPTASASLLNILVISACLQLVSWSSCHNIADTHKVEVPTVGHCDKLLRISLVLILLCDV